MSSFATLFGPKADPPTPLGRLRILGPNAAIRVSPLCLGAMNIGGAWGEVMGTSSKESSFELMDYFFDSGGNFIDTANNYQNEESEIWIGEWMAKRKNRDQIVLATKYSSPYNTYDKSIAIHANYTGNHTKSLKLSLADSLRKLQTDYIDLLYVHWWDHTTSIPELMQSLNQLVASGKVLYLGVSDTPAWIVSKANQYAADHGLRGFSVYQGKWSASMRDMERDILPMTRADGLAVCPWGAMGQGAFKTKEQFEEMNKSGEKGRNGRPATENDKKVTVVLDKLARAKGKSITAIALAYVLQSQPYVHPIVGGRKVSHLKDNIEALTIQLSAEDLDEIHKATDFAIGFPHDMVGQSASQNVFIKNAGVLDSPPAPKACGQS
ncbi:Norsolorinic acid reductase [Taphrina deformans PYCC 5710]|uniref:Norsolorinic acid reductase n=1 Tax=Taphrina deformans (strain PYCC 5710 / ATCC 11124 / CBS 356.35 / IMI 108563 / JCM 9778 / NBRC 8474) TaxID=1097556 RepID=R4XBF4_TAPDE|nr:Norsolorinic acid reductase [Taphrina deformans PYCC 5710]|eukprot:CCG80668.1 Norsolorinic acid reductase [Taphrina deformans PYCC 5710]